MASLLLLAKILIDTTIPRHFYIANCPVEKVYGLPPSSLFISFNCFRKLFISFTVAFMHFFNSFGVISSNSLFVTSLGDGTGGSGSFFFRIFSSSSSCGANTFN